VLPNSDGEVDASEEETQKMSKIMGKKGIFNKPWNRSMNNLIWLRIRRREITTAII
jgi:hypothetical protein